MDSSQTEKCGVFESHAIPDKILYLPQFSPRIYCSTFGGKVLNGSIHKENILKKRQTFTNLQQNKKARKLISQGF